MIKHKKQKRRTSETVLLNEIELLLAEKRTYFSTLRTGIAIATLPLTVAIFMIATQDFHNMLSNALYTYIASFVLAGITVSGVVMALVSSRKLQKINETVKKIEGENKRIKRIIV